MKKTFVLFVVITFVLIPADHLWAAISKVSGAPICNGAPCLTPGKAGTYYVEGPGVDLTTGLAVSNAALTATIQRKWNGAENAASGGNPLYGKLQIYISASASAPGGNHIVYINYNLGLKDNLTVKVVTASITGYSAPTFSAPVVTTTVRLTGTGLGYALTNATVDIIKDATHPLLNAFGMDTQNAGTLGNVEASTNTDTQADVKVNFQQALTKVTLKITLASTNPCSGLSRQGGASFTLSLTAPKSPILGSVIRHTYDKPVASYKVGDIVNVTVLLDSPVCLPTKTFDTSLTKIPTCHTPGTLYWYVSPSTTAIQQAGSTPYNPASTLNQITVPGGQQTAVISFKIVRCHTGGQQFNSLWFITRKPDPNNMNAPNHLPTNFSYSCTP